MRYTRFVIENYRAIAGPLEIVVSKSRLMPIIGVNESGKTTVLHAIFAFDHYNDDLNDGGRHLKDVANLYRTSAPPPTVSAEIEFTLGELKTTLASCEKENPAYKTAFSTMKGRRKLPTKLLIRRNIVTKKYSILESNFFGLEVQDILARKLLYRLPYTLYFDDFRDKILERIEVPAKEDDSPPDWLGMMEQLFKQTDPTFSVFKLANLEDRQRRTVLAKVERHLNETLTKEWHSFRLDDREALRIAISFEQESVGIPRNYLKLDVVETDIKGDRHFFYISDRSKGFYWFFNFVMKLEFNPKVVSSGLDGEHSIYLLDEPGSYLHAFAQRKLCQKLKQISGKNTVIYCTHTHYLLDPEVIPPNNIVVAEKNGKGDVALIRMIDYQGSITDKRSALQPVLDALQVKPYALDLVHTKGTLIVEGIYDYFAIEMFRKDRSFLILPSVGAGSIKFYVSLMIAWQVNFRALWDNDNEGRKKLQDATDHFGTELARRHFRLIPSTKATGHRIMQDLFDGSDLVKLRQQLELPNNCPFEKIIQTLFYSPKRSELLSTVSESTQQHFAELVESLNFA